MPENIEEFRRKLLERRAELERISESSAASRSPVELDQQSVGRLSRMDALQQQAMAKATEERRALDLKRINAALRRLESDGFGECVRCGEEIEARRLEFDPAVTLCLQCARGEEG